MSKGKIRTYAYRFQEVLNHCAAFQIQSIIKRSHSHKLASPPASPYFCKVIPRLLRLGFREDVDDLVELRHDEVQFLSQHFARAHNLFVVI